MFKADLCRRAIKPLALAVAVTLCAGSVVQARISKGGGTNKVLPYPVPVHGPGSSHNPIVVPKNCNDPNTVCRRP
jgi:hypothetical protein